MNGGCVSQDGLRLTSLDSSCALSHRIAVYNAIGTKNESNKKSNQLRLVNSGNRAIYTISSYVSLKETMGRRKGKRRRRRSRRER